MDRENLIKTIQEKFTRSDGRLDSWFGKSKALVEAEALRNFTSFLPEDKGNAYRLNVLCMGITSLPKCENCGGRFAPATFGLQQNGRPIRFCSVKCSSLFEDDNKRRKEAYLKTRSQSPYRNHSLEWYIWKYGEEEGKNKYEKFVDKSRQTLENYVRIHGEIVGLEKYESMISKKAQTLDRFVEIYGEEDGSLKYEEYRNMIGMSIEKCVARHGPEDGLTRYNKWLAAIRAAEKKNPFAGRKMFDVFVEKYGEEKGTEKYMEWVGKTQVGIGRASKESLKILSPLIRMFTDLGTNLDDIYYGADDKDEFFIFSRRLKKHFFFDFFIRSHKFAIEYNGKTWHPSEKDLVNRPNEVIPRLGITVEQKYEWDKSKLIESAAQGIMVVTINCTDGHQAIASKVSSGVSFLDISEETVLNYLNNNT